MKLKEQVKIYLEENPRARERRVRANTVWEILKDRFQLEQLGENMMIDKRFFIDEAFTEIQNINRVVRKVQQDYPELRGRDYEDKYILEKNYQSNLGYEGRYYQDLKFFKNL